MDELELVPSGSAGSAGGTKCKMKKINFDNSRQMLSMPKFFRHYIKLAPTICMECGSRNIQYSYPDTNG